MQSGRNLFAELYRRNPLLTFLGWLHVLTLLAAVVGLWTDDRVVMGDVNVWLKPTREMLSAVVWLWTIAWLSRYIRRPRWALRSVSIAIAAAALVQTACILLQAGRGGMISPSAYATDFDAVMFRIVAAMAGVRMVAAVVILFLFGQPGVRLPPVFRAAIRAGLVLFLAAGAIGIVIIANGGPVVGAPDSIRGLPFLNWSRIGGDLRISQALAARGLQILPLIGFGIVRWTTVPSRAAKFVLLGAAAALYVTLVVYTFSRAMDGVPLF